eukprot:361415-Chlamydomonas_euryale.AAC.13
MRLAHLSCGGRATGHACVTVCPALCDVLCRLGSFSRPQRKARDRGRMLALCDSAPLRKDPKTIFTATSKVREWLRGWCGTSGPSGRLWRLGVCANGRWLQRGKRSIGQLACHAEGGT